MVLNATKCAAALVCIMNKKKEKDEKQDEEGEKEEAGWVVVGVERKC